MEHWAACTIRSPAGCAVHTHTRTLIHKHAHTHKLGKGAPEVFSSDEPIILKRFLKGFLLGILSRNDDGQMLLNQLQLILIGWTS